MFELGLSSSQCHNNLQHIPGIDWTRTYEGKKVDWRSAPQHMPGWRSRPVPHDEAGRPVWSCQAARKGHSIKKSCHASVRPGWPCCQQDWESPRRCWRVWVGPAGAEVALPDWTPCGWPRHRPARKPPRTRQRRGPEAKDSSEQACMLSEQAQEPAGMT